MKKLFIVFLLFLSSCSFHTLYEYEGNSYAKLSQVGLGKIDGKRPFLIKQIFQNEFYLNEDDLHKTKKYEIYLNLGDGIGDWLIQSDSTILRKSLIINANFSLKSIKTGKVIDSGQVKSIVIFSESPSAWSSYVSEEKAYENATKDVMRLIRIQTSLLLAKLQKKEEEYENKHKGY